MGRTRARMTPLKLPTAVVKRFNAEAILACDIVEGVVACNKDVRLDFLSDTRKQQLVSDAHEVARTPLTPFMQRVLKECPKTWPCVFYMLDVVGRKCGLVLTQETVRRSIIGALYLLLSTEDNRDALTQYLPRRMVKRCGNAFLELLNEAQQTNHPSFSPNTPARLGSPVVPVPSMPPLGQHPRSSGPPSSGDGGWRSPRSCSFPRSLAQSSSQSTLTPHPPTTDAGRAPRMSLMMVTSVDSLTETVADDDAGLWSDDDDTSTTSADESWEQTLGMQNIGWVRAALPRIARMISRAHARAVAAPDVLVSSSSLSSPRSRLAGQADPEVVHIIPDGARSGRVSTPPSSVTLSLSMRCSDVSSIVSSGTAPKAAAHLRAALSFESLNSSGCLASPYASRAGTH